MNGAQLWLALALVGGALAIAALARYLLRLRSRSADLTAEAAEEMAHLSPTPLQKRARWSLSIALALSLATAALLGRHGPVSVFEDRALRLLYTGLLLGVVASYLILLLPIHHQRGRARLVLDERDRAILGRASSSQAAAGLIVLGVWAVVLTEIYWDQGAVPIVFPYLIFESIFIVYMLAFAAGILLSYRLWRIHGES